MRTPTLLAVVLAACCCGGVLGLGETFSAETMAAIKPVPQAYDVASAVRANGTVIRDTECKNCPYGNCINFGWIPAGLTAPFQCFTQGENVGNTKYVKVSTRKLHRTHQHLEHGYDMPSGLDKMSFAMLAHLIWSQEKEIVSLVFESDIMNKLIPSSHSRLTLLRHEIGALFLSSKPEGEDPSLHRV